MAGSSMAAVGFRALLIGALLSGCTTIAADGRTFQNTRWRVVAIDGHATPARDPFSVEFFRSTYSARMGCNQARGQYRTDGPLLIPAGMISTEMACEAVPATGIPLMTYEEWGFRVFRQPMRMHWTGSSRLTLVNHTGSISLQLAK